MEGERQGRRFVLVTGLSGAGKTRALHALEDLGYFAVDNIPPALIPKLAELIDAAWGVPRAALVVDCRQDPHFGGITLALEVLDGLGVEPDILYLEANDATLIRRYQESRRMHPLAPGGSVPEGIARERERLAPIRRRATVIVDTTGLTPHALTEKLDSLFLAPDSPRPTLHLVSFGFKYGIPADADLVFDVRGLPNPHYDPVLGPLPGTDPRVMSFVLDQEVSRRLLDRMESLMREYLSHLREEGRPGLVVAVGCTGGRHRSVAAVEQMRRVFEADPLPVTVDHRHLGKEGLPSGTSSDG